MIPGCRFLPRPRARRALRSRTGPCAALGVLLAVSCLAPGRARAQCVPDASDPTVIECTGTFEESYVADQDEIDLTVVTGAEMSNDPDADTIHLNDQSSITIEDGARVRNDAAGGAAASVGNDGLVTNDGEISVEGTGGIGISAEDGGNLVNRGLIDLVGSDTIGIRALDGSAGVTNEGTISGSADGSVGIRVGSTNPVVNAGAITLEGGGSIGVELLGDGNVFTNLGDVSASGAGSMGVVVEGAGEPTDIVNLGSITVGAGGGPAVSFENSGPLDDPDAAYSLTADAGSLIDGGDGLAVLGGDFAEFFSNSGTALGHVNLAGGDDSLQLLGEGVLDTVELGEGSDVFELFAGGSFTMVDGGAGDDLVLLTSGIQSADTLDLATLAGFEQLVLEAGEWTLQNDASFSTGIDLGGGILRIVDPVSLTADMEALALSTLELSNTLELTGDYTQRLGSTFAVALGSGPTDGLLAVDGVATIDAGASLGIIEQAPLSGSFTILTATGGIDGTFSELPEATPVLSFDLTNTGNELVLEILRNPYTTGATTPNQRAVAGALDGVLMAGPDEDMQELLASLDRVPTAEYGAALDSLQPEAYDAQTSAMLGFGYSFARLAASNLFECPPTYYPHLPTWITSGPPCAKDGWTPWIGAFGSFADRNGGSGHIDYNGQGGGVAVGAGRSFGTDWEVSAYVGSGFGWLDVQQVGDGSLQTFEAGVGAVRRIGAFSLRGVVDYGHGWHQQDRRAMVGTYEQRPGGEYQSNRVTGLLEAAWQLVAAETNFFEPVASVDFTWLDEESFRESGGGAADLAVGARSQTVVSTTLGMRLVRTFLKGRYATDWAQWANGTWRPELDVRWRANWTDVDRDISARFAGAPEGTGSFTVRAQDAKQGAEFAIGTTYQPYKTQALVTAGYRGFVGDGTQIHSVGAEVRIPF